MRKSHDFNEMSDRQCRSCGKMLKARIVENKTPKNAHLCYKCYANIRYAPVNGGKLSGKNATLVFRENTCSHRDAVRLA